MIMSRSKIFYIALSLPLLLSACGGEEGGGGRDGAATGKTIMETGTLEAVNSRAFIAPRFQRWFELKVTGLLEHGAIVEAGDSMIQFDLTEVNKFLVDVETNLENQTAALDKLIVDQENNINALESTLKSEQASFDLKKIELEASKFETERYQKVKNLEFEQATITMRKNERKLELTRIINENDLKIQKIRVKQVENQIVEIDGMLKGLTLHASQRGVFQIGTNWRTGNLIQVGDIVYPGNPVGYVPELKFMKVETFINETDFLKIHVGQKVAVRLDAMPRVVFDGEIADIGKLCIDRPNSKEKGFEVEVNIIKSDERLKPGMTVSCEFLPD